MEKTVLAVRAVKTLSAHYSQLGLLSHLGRERLNSQNLAFRILIGTILSHRTKDERTEIATRRLLSKFSSPRKLSVAPLREITRLIKPVGFYNSKARYVKACAGELEARFGGVVPKTMRELVSLTGVGRKTAGCVLAYAFRLPAIPVDSHVHQVSNRLGIVKTKTPEKTEVELMKIIPKSLWVEVNEVFVVHGQQTCVPLSPKCSQCQLESVCLKVGVKNRR